MRDQSEGAVFQRDPILENIEPNGFILTYGVDYDPASGIWHNDLRLHGWVSGLIAVNYNIVAVRVQLSARPNSNNPDLDRLSPRSLDTVAAVRNQMISNRDLTK
jgi:hypothetical protein